jgi:hypothetical protein
LKFPPLNTAVRISWLDTTSLPGWHYTPEDETVDSTPRQMLSLGYLVGQGPVAITLSHTISPQGVMDSKTGRMDLLIIPRGCITRVQALP